ncbi:MAG TPA: hypothetical protein VHQ64_10340 [Pyrinomonadaceae bacterium]|nr:hypothetical protein [Pyrinomonadaceae bacterium]
MSQDDCQTLRAELAQLRADLKEAKQTLIEDTKAGLDTHLLRQQILRLQHQISTVTDALRNCDKNVLIIGTEFTQAIQYWNFPAGQGTGSAPNNSIPLVAGKPTIVRVYPDVIVRRDRFNIPNQITGSLRVSSQAGPINLPPLGGPITAQAASLINRASLRDTINFRIPWQYCSGEITCRIRINDVAQPSDFDEEILDLTFEDVPLLDVHSVLIHYQGPDFFDKPVDARATGLDVLLTLDYVLRTYPISGFNFDGCEVLTWTKKVATNQGFSDLHAQIASMRAMAGSSDTYIALLPPQAGCASTCGLGGGDVALYFADSPPEASHEIGHALDRKHTQCSQTASDPDTKYPTYNGLPQGSIGEVGFDAARIALFDPHTTFDFMSYCAPVWVGPYTYLALREAAYNQVGVSPPEEYIRSSPWGAESADFYHLRLRVHRGDVASSVEMTSAFHLPRKPPRWPAEAEGLKLELLDEAGLLLDVATAIPSHEHHHSEGPFDDYHADFPRPASLRTIRVVDEGKVLETIEVGHEAPRVQITEVKRVKSNHGNIMRVTWHGEAASPNSLRYGVRFSHDGKKWRALASGITETQHVFDLDLLPGGEHCRVQIVASASLRTTTAETELFHAPVKRRVAYIAAPAAGVDFYVGQPIGFVGGGFSPDFGLSVADEVFWVARAVGPIGTGHQVSTTELPVGLHRVTMYVRDGLGGEASASVDVRVKPAMPCGCAHQQPPKMRGRCPHCGH